uniref:NAD(P)(+)--arginine ADP-ribosyltransferase n=1 Tax=Esox lucius TaxID=8010 RepID=A0A3P9AL59_ESOLU
MFNIPVTSQEKKMDMAPNAVDDQYIECRDEMLKKVQGVLEKEQKDSPEDYNTWAESQKCTQTIPGGVKEHTAALVFYGNKGHRFEKKFNNAVATLGANFSVYESFQFKSLHFLLMDAMRLLKTGKCKTVFHGSEQKYTAQVGSEVRFGTFTSASDQMTAEKEKAISESGTLFNITSCTAVNIEKYACIPEWIEMLVSPAEVFKVVEVKVSGRVNEKHTEIVLTSSRNVSNHDCFLFPSYPPTTAPTGASTQQFSSSIYRLVTVSLVISLFTRTSLTK